MSLLSRASRDLAFVVSLAKTETDTIGFIPRSRYELYLDAGTLRIQRVNGQRCGFLCHGLPRRGQPVHVYQCCIQTDARRLQAATTLITTFIFECRCVGATEILLRCRTDIEANWFWQAMRFDPINIEPAGARRGGTITTYRRLLQPAFKPCEFANA